MLSMRKFSTVLIFLSVLVSVPVSADSFTGYVVESLNGFSGNNTNYEGSLIGLSTTPTGPVTVYRTVIDPTYGQMLASARIHRQLVTVSGPSPAIGGVYIRR